MSGVVNPGGLSPAVRRAIQEASEGPKGVLDRAVIAGDQGTFTTSTDITGLTVEFARRSGRMYMVHARLYVSASVGNTEVQVLVASDAGTTLGRARVNCVTADAFYHVDVFVPIATLSDASSSLKVTASRVSGTGLVTSRASVLWPAFLIAQDLGKI